VDIMSLIVSLLSGAVGGNVAGALLKDKTLGTLGNSIAGILGGGLGATLLQGIGLLPGGEMLGGVAGGGAGGAILMIVIGLIKNAMASKA
jgi:uncharacterized membrane protein YeaQ/YmgE (transglycosylase-associated protein family)